MTYFPLLAILGDFTQSVFTVAVLQLLQFFNVYFLLFVC